MASLFDIPLEISVPQRQIIEPLNAPKPLDAKIREFFPEELFTLGESTLHQMLLSFLGDGGVGSVKKALLYPRLQNAISTTYFGDLDSLFGNPLRLARLSDEIYDLDPQHHILTVDQWNEVRRKDAWYRARCLDYMRGIQLGNTPEGIALIARAASGIECDVFERYLYLDDQDADISINVPNIGRTESRNEFVIVPRTFRLSPIDRRRIVNVVNRLRPANMVFSVMDQREVQAIVLGEEQPLLTEVAIADIASSSDYFRIKRLVTGNPSITYPPVNADQATWIEAGIEKEAPTYAFGERSEMFTFLTIGSAEASSFHVGPFNQLQKLLFSHLEDVPNNFYPFQASESFSTIPVNHEITTLWVNRDRTPVLINGHYPLDYFNSETLENRPSRKLFWASQEKEPPETDHLIIDLQSVRPVNWVEFEISRKPILVQLEYLNENTQEWTPVTYRADMENNTEFHYVASKENSWEHTDLNFELVQTSKLRLTFTRKMTAFPYPHSPSFEWSIEIRKFRAAHSVATVEDFVPDTGVDILGNAYRTTLDATQYGADRANDGALNTFWQSQANPSRFAVESLYLDIRDEGEATTFDQIYLDPVQGGCLVNFYYSDDDDELDWDLKLWSPVPRRYILTKGFHTMPQPILAKYVKIEFTKLTPSPYSALNQSHLQPIRYRLHPTWVYEHIQNLVPPVEDLFATLPSENVTLDYITLGLAQPGTTRLTEEGTTRLDDFIEVTRTTTSSQQISDISTQAIEDIQVYPNDLFQTDLATTFEDDYLSRYLRGRLASTEAFVREEPLQPKALVAIASKSDREAVQAEKAAPDTWFPMRCRHGYKVIETHRDFKIAYYVSIREVSVWRRNPAMPMDSDVYHETLANSNSWIINDFQQVDWRWTVPVEQTELALTGSENFDDNETLM